LERRKLLGRAGALVNSSFLEISLMDIDSIFDMTDILTPEQLEIRRAVQKITADFPDSYWLERDTDGKFPHDFGDAVAAAGWFGVTMPKEYGGAGLGVTEAAVVTQVVGESGGASAAMSTVIHAMFGPQTIWKYGTEEQKKRWVPGLMKREIRPCFGVTEPNTGLDTTRLKTRAVKKDKTYYVTGQKIWTSTAQIANKIMLITRTTPIEETKRPIDGLTLFFTDLNRKYAEVRRIPKMGRLAVDSNQVFFDNMPVPEEDRIGEEGKGFYYLLDSLNPERILVAAGTIGIGRRAIARAADYAKNRVVFGRPIGQNQAIQHPLAESWAKLQAANMMTFKAAELFDTRKSCGAFANAAKLLGAEASYEACERAVMTHGGMGYAKEFHVERYLRESIILRIGPVTPPLMLSFLAEKVLGLPKSY